MLNLIYSYIDTNRERFVQELERLVAQPSISLTGEGMEECAHLLERWLIELGLDTKILRTGGAPMVYGEKKVPHSNKKLLLFDHYDVVPPGSLENWSNPPFAPVIHANRIRGRGAGDAKGQLFTYLKAIEAWHAVRGELPCCLGVAFNGDNEIGAPNFVRLAEQYPDKLKADAVFFADASTLDVWGPVIYLGNRGVLAFDLVVHGPATSVHSGSYGGLVKNPAIRLANALACLRDPKGQILVKGFYDDLEPLGELQQRLLNSLKLERESKLKNLGTTEFWGDPGHNYFETQMYRPTLNVHGLTCGYQDRGWVAMVPSTATAKIDINIVPNLNHDDIKQKIQRHLVDHDFDDIEIRETGRSPYATSARLDDPFLAIVSRALERVWGTTPVLYPSIGGGGGLVRIFKEQIGNPHFLMVPFGQPDMNEHSPTESLDLDWFVRGIKAVVTVIDEFAKSDIGR